MLIDNYSNTKRRGYCLIQCLTLVTVVLLLAFFAPNAEETINSDVTYEAHQLNDSQVLYELSVSNTNSLNRYMIIGIEATTNSMIGVEKEISVKGEIYGSSENKDTKEKSKEIQVIDKKLIIKCPFPKNSKTDRSCETTKLVQLTNLNYKKYFLSLTITENSAIEALKKIDFQYTVVSKSKSILTLCIRSCFAFGCLIFLFVWLLLSRRSIEKSRSIEQKWIPFLIILLFFYNNPMHSTIYYLDSSAWELVEIIFETFFLATVLLFLLSIFHSLRLTSLNYSSQSKHGEIKRGFLRFYLTKILFSILFFAFLTTEAIFGRLQSWGFTHEELFPWEKSNYPVIVISILIQLIALFWFLYLFYRSRIECVPHPVLNMKWRYLSNSIIILFVIVIIAITLEKSLKLTNSSFLEISFLIVSNLWIIAFSIPFIPTQGTRKILKENSVPVDSLRLSDNSKSDTVSSQYDNEFELSENQYGEDLNSQESFKENSSEF
ncbi:transmembrane protein [Anaeramoeba flamelloides]|uniref:Transmembrane protein n=1 Tax=Anaeramoeba flamelloides TaxID=1746091 RepID=A0ABQ8XQ80_9EUKA|nr:transmembrane protein [Anaeramoeba flamelloides]